MFIRKSILMVSWMLGRITSLILITPKNTSFLISFLLTYSIARNTELDIITSLGVVFLLCMFVIMSVEVLIDMVILLDKKVNGENNE